MRFPPSFAYRFSAIPAIRLNNGIAWESHRLQTLSMCQISVRIYFILTAPYLNFGDIS